MATATPRATTAPRQTLPLPRELRDEVYSYLLDAERVELRTMAKDPMDETTSFSASAPTYDFHTNILAVNKATGAEAAELLYKRNTFVQVSIQDMPHLKRLLRALQVPILNSQDIIGWSLYVGVAGSKFQDDAMETDATTFSVLARDLPVLSKALQWSLFAVRPWDSMLASGLGQAAQPVDEQIMFDPSTAAISLEVHTCRNQGEARNINAILTAAKETMLLEPFRFCTPSTVRDDTTPLLAGTRSVKATAIALETTIGASRVWLNAMAWDLLGEAITMSGKVEAVFRRKEWSQVVELAEALVDPLKDCLLFKLTSDQLNTQVLEPMFRAMIVVLDIATYALAACLKMRKITFAAQLVQKNLPWISIFKPLTDLQNLGLLPVLHLVGNTAPMHPHATWTTILLDLLTAKSEPAWYYLQRDGEGIGFEARLLEQCAQAVPTAEHLAHDIAVLRKLHREEGITGNATKPLAETLGVDYILDQLSVSKMEDMTFKTTAAYEYKVPDGIVGWIDELEEAKLVGGT